MMPIDHPLGPSSRALFESIPNPVACIDSSDVIVDANPAAERFFGFSRARLITRRLNEILPKDSPIIALVSQVRERDAGITEHGIEVHLPRPTAEAGTGEQILDIYASPMAGEGNFILLSVQERSLADKITRQLSHRGAARSVSAMAAVLAHEIKNPLSGIRGAAQLLEGDRNDGSASLTALICDEVDRIVRLVERFESFSDRPPLNFHSINIHEVLDHVRVLARSGFAGSVRFTEDFDPSLPPVHGDRDQLVQVMLNIVKNAAEAVAGIEDAEIGLTTAYRPGVHVVVPTTGERTSLPLEVCVTDNGPGIPDGLVDHVFEPFVTTKSYGSGLGLATVAKIVSDHGGVIECERIKRRTRFRILLPVRRDATKARG